MANNKVQLADGTTLIDLTDTTAAASDVAAGKYFYTAAGVKTEGIASGGGGGSQTITGTFTGSGNNIATISCSFAPDVIYVFGNVSIDPSLRGIVSFEIIKDTCILVTADSSTSAAAEYLLYSDHAISGYGTDTDNPYATYSSGTLTINTVYNSGTARWASGLTYSYKLVAYGS